MFDSIRSAFRGFKEFIAWCKEFHARLYDGVESERFRNNYLKAAREDYYLGHKADKGTLKWLRWLIPVTPAMFICRLIWPGLGFRLIFCVCLISLFIVLKRFYHIMVEIDRLAIEGVRSERRHRIEGLSAEESLKLVLQEYKNGHISRKLEKDREELAKKRAEEAHRAFERKTRGYGFYADSTRQRHSPPN